jgi:glyoxylase-like metal-dependent hydrolase (beta-lactamase superfamily II)
LATTQIFPNVHALALGPVNVFFIEDGPHLAVIDTGYVGSAPAILDAARALGRQPNAITNIVLTHCHPDHAGSLAELQAATGAAVWMHRADAEVVRGNTPMVRSTPAPGLLNRVLYQLFIARVPGEVPVCVIDHEITDGQVLPIGPGLRAVHTPGHSAGHTAFVLDADGGLLFAGDTCSNMAGLALSIVYDDLAEGKRSLARLTELTFVAACFGHGKPLDTAGTARFRKKWAA